jgi:hypothetical protein
MADRILWPFGLATKESLVYGATIGTTIWNNKTLLTVAQLTGSPTFNLLPDAEIALGASVSVRFSANGTNRTVTLGANMVGDAIAVNANKEVVCTFEWGGAGFVHISTEALN